MARVLRSASKIRDPSKTLNPRSAVSYDETMCNEDSDFEGGSTTDAEDSRSNNSKEISSKRRAGNLGVRQDTKVTESPFRVLPPSTSYSDLKELLQLYESSPSYMLVFQVAIKLSIND